MYKRRFSGLAILCAAWFFLSNAPNITGARSPEDVKSASPLNEQNLRIILDNRGKFTESDLTKMLGPPSLIERSEALSISILRMDWEEVNRIEVKCRDGVVVAVSGTFSPSLPSRIINYSAFKKLQTGTKANDVQRESFIGWAPRIVKDASAGTTTLVYEQYNRFHIHFHDGKVTTAVRVWHTDDHLNTLAK